MKQTYKLKKHYSILHTWLNEEGFGTQDISDMLDITEQTCRSYLKDPTMLRAKHINCICKELDVDANFIMDIIKQ